MEHNRKRWPGFKVIEGGLQRSIHFSGIHIVASPLEFPPFSVEALAFEEDTFLVMGADPAHAEEAAHPLRLMAQLADLRPETPGTVIAKGNNPIQLLAIVHDVENIPTWREKWVKKALYGIFEIAEKRYIKTLGLPLIGTQYGTMDTNLCAGIIGSILSQQPVRYLKKIWIIAPVPVNGQIMETLAAYATAA